MVLAVQNILGGLINWPTHNFRGEVPMSEAHGVLENFGPA
jgi:hypothetical protein